MKIALKNGTVFLKDVDADRFAVIKSWGLMKYDRTRQMLVGAETLELLNKLLMFGAMPSYIETERKTLLAIETAINDERLKDEPALLCPVPLKPGIKLFKHQIRGINMALIRFGLDPESAKHKGGDAI